MNQNIECLASLQRKQVDLMYERLWVFYDPHFLVTYLPVSATIYSLPLSASDSLSQASLSIAFGLGRWNRSVKEVL